VNFDALPALPAARDGAGTGGTGAGHSYCAVLLLRASDPLAAEGADVEALRALLDEDLPQFSPFVDDGALAAVAAKASSRLPGFRFVGPAVASGGALLLGDAIHTVKPYFGLGANAAFEDVAALEAALDASATGAEALAAFSRARAPEAKALVQISRGFDRPGVLGFATFVLPIILDAVFHGALPRFFGPNAIASLQRDGTFVQVRRRKRRDRLLQVACLSGGLGAAGVGARVLARAALLATPRSRRLAVLGAAGAAALGLARKLAFLKRGMDPADVLASTNSDITAVDGRSARP
jgi:hypothetical protein